MYTVFDDPAVTLFPLSTGAYQRRLQQDWRSSIVGQQEPIVEAIRRTSVPMMAKFGLLRARNSPGERVPRPEYVDPLEA